MRIEKCRVDNLNPAPYNPRKDLQPGDKTYDSLKRSVETFGHLQPIIVNKRTRHVVGGHQRLKVLKDLGRKMVDVVYVDIPIEEEKALNLTLNKSVGEWDEPKLASLLQEFEAFPQVEVELTGFTKAEAKAVVDHQLDIAAGTGEDDFDVDAALDNKQKFVTKQGELIKLGQHRLLCGDSTDPEQVRRLMDGERAILFATDPPYLVGLGPKDIFSPSKKHFGRRVKKKDWSDSYGLTWDEKNWDQKLYEGFCRAAIAEAVLPNAAWYLWHSHKHRVAVETLWNKLGIFVHQEIIWVKMHAVMAHSEYRWQHETCIYGWVKPNRPPTHGTAGSPTTVWQFSRPTLGVGARTLHPATKPIELFAIPMRQHTRRGEICYEPFCGSGSQIIAAEKLGRRCFALEISPQYCDVIVRRWIAFVGETEAPELLVRRYAVQEKKSTHKVKRVRRVKKL